MQVSVGRYEIGSLYASHADWLTGWLRRRTRCPEKALDLTHDTFCRLLEQPEARLPGAPRSYLATIARRLIIDDARRAKVENAFLEAHAMVMDGVSHPAPDRIAEAVKELLAVVQALEALPERVRRAYLLSRLDGWCHGEIAATLGVSRSMVKQYVAKAYAHCYEAAYRPSREME